MNLLQRIQFTSSMPLRKGHEFSTMHFFSFNLSPIQRWSEPTPEASFAGFGVTLVDSPRNTLHHLKNANASLQARKAPHCALHNLLSSRPHHPYCAPWRVKWQFCLTWMQYFRSLVYSTNSRTQTENEGILPIPRAGFRHSGAAGAEIFPTCTHTVWMWDATYATCAGKRSAALPHECILEMFITHLKVHSVLTAYEISGDGTNDYNVKEVDFLFVFFSRTTSVKIKRCIAICMLQKDWLDWGLF